MEKSCTIFKNITMQWFINKEYLLSTYLLFLIKDFNLYSIFVISLDLYLSMNKHDD